MAMSTSELAEEIQKAVDSKDKDDKPIDVTPEMEAYAKAVINTLKATTVTFLPFTVEGTAPAVPGPVPDLKASNGTFLPPLPTLASSVWLGVMLAANPTANPVILLAEAIASTTYLQTVTVEFDVQKMKGNSTAVGPPTPAPGILLAGQGAKGMIKGLDGSKWANAVIAVNPGMDPVQAKKIYTAMADYISKNAEVIYGIQTINGSFAAISTPLIAGTAIGGIIN